MSGRVTKICSFKNVAGEIECLVSYLGFVRVVDSNIERPEHNAP